MVLNRDNLIIEPRRVFMVHVFFAQRHSEPFLQWTSSNTTSCQRPYQRKRPGTQEAPVKVHLCLF